MNPDLSLFSLLQTSLGAQFQPFLLSPSTLTQICLQLPRLLQAETVALGIPDHTFASHVSSATFWFGSRPPAVSLSHLFWCPIAAWRKLQQEWFVIIWGETHTLALIGQALPSPAITETPATAFWTQDAKAIAILISQLQSIIQTQQPHLLQQWPSHGVATNSSCLPAMALLQLLDASLQTNAELTRKLSYTDALQANLHELRQSLSYRDEFLASVCQQLRTPLTNIKTAAQLLRSPRIRDAQKGKYWEVLNSECDHQISLISSLIELITIDQDMTLNADAPVVLFDLVPGIVSTYQALAQEKGLMLAYTIPASIPSVHFPEAALKQVLVKLIENAINFTPAGGQIWLTANANAPFVQIEVRDTGIGIPPEDLAKIFERFYRVPRARMDIPGVGLGLTIVQKLLLGLGGAVSVRSELGQGSTFTVLLPTA